MRFEVKETGIGIVADNLPHIFERYWKSDRQGRQGAGLGLYIAKGIVKGHGGRICVDSSPGAGSSLQFELPILSVPEKERPGSHLSPPSQVSPKRPSTVPVQHAHR